ncbi:ABC transporter permease [Microbacterium arabinogalactanolyticum]|uniref:ABC transporter permease n=1 Tax=Microbacterium arabinogalactanolyticum TaxID=69365 RepID=UPI0040445125
MAELIEAPMGADADTGAVTPTSARTHTGVYDAPADTHTVAVARMGRSGRALPRITGKLLSGLIIVGAIALFGVLGPLVVGDPHDASHEPLLPPSPAHLLGTAKLGHDVLAQIATGTQGSLFVGVVAGLVALLLALVFGVLAGYFGGALDEVLMLITNIMLVIPGLPLVMIIATYVQHTEGLGALARSSLLVALVLGITGWAGSAVVLRGTARSLRTRDYVAASVVAGERPLRIIFVEILPNLVPLLAAQLIFGVIFAVLGEAGLSYLGLGPTGSITLGTVLNDAQTGQAVGSGAWWWFVPPGAIIALIGTGLSLINFAIDEIVNPKLRLAPAAARRQRRAQRAEAAARREKVAA